MGGGSRSLKSTQMMDHRVNISLLLHSLDTDVKLQEITGQKFLSEKKRK